MAIRLATELDVTPDEALLLEVRRSAARAAWLDAHVQQAARRLDEIRELEVSVNGETAELGLPAGIIDLNRESRRERHHLATVAKAAIDAEVSQRMVANVEAETRVVFAMLIASLDRLQLTDDQRALALAAAREQLAQKLELTQAPELSS
jgi:hypothetical protein